VKEVWEVCFGLDRGCTVVLDLFDCFCFYFISIFSFEGSQWCNGLRHAFNILPLRSQVQSPVLALIFI
jgi:hypothetical protein